MLLLIVAVLLVGVTVAYAALSATLNVTVNKVTQNAGSFSVVFNNTGSSVAATTVGGTSATGRSCGTATITASSVTISDTQLSKPDDSCQYTLVLKNTGTITAKLVSITPTNPSGTTCSTSSGARMICGASGKEITYTITLLFEINFYFRNYCTFFMTNNSTYTTNNLIMCIAFISCNSQILI